MEHSSLLASRLAGWLDAKHSCRHAALRCAAPTSGGTEGSKRPWAAAAGCSQQRPSAPMAWKNALSRSRCCWHCQPSAPLPGRSRASAAEGLAAGIETPCAQAGCRLPGTRLPGALASCNVAQQEQRQPQNGSAPWPSSLPHSPKKKREHLPPQPPAPTAAVLTNWRRSTSSLHPAGAAATPPPRAGPVSSSSATGAPRTAQRPPPAG